MKKVYLMFALAGAALLTACDPVEDDYSNNVTSITSADDIKVTYEVEKQNGKAVNQVHVNADGNKMPINISNGVNTLYSTCGDILLFSEGENTIYVNAQNADGTILTKEIKVNVETMAYDVPKEYNLLTSGSSKTWTWDTDTDTSKGWGDGRVWGNSGNWINPADFPMGPDNAWWGATPGELAGQLGHSSTGTATGEEDPNAYMVWSLNGTKIETFNANGEMIRSGKFSIESWDKCTFGIGLLTTTAESILFPWQINTGGKAPTDFNVFQLDEEKMILSVTNGDSGELTWWRFMKK